MAFVKHAATQMQMFKSPISTERSHYWMFEEKEQLGLFYCLYPVGEAVAIFDANTVGPRSYIRMYDSYRDILTGDTLLHQGQSSSKPRYLFQGQSEKDKDAFLASDASLEQFKARMDG